MSTIVVSIVSQEDWDDLLVLWQADELESHGTAPERVRQGALRSRETFDFLATDCFWVLLARRDGRPAGHAHLCRIPKADARVGFLYVDQLFVHPEERRQGVALALLQRTKGLSQELGLAGVRLLVEPDAEGPRALYRKAGFEELTFIQCQWKAPRE